jgi:hypothetical protein
MNQYTVLSAYVRRKRTVDPEREKLEMGAMSDQMSIHTS